ncbi:MAG: single-stranded DNA-binding protein [Verrucomicrobiales bacterium]|nr:single-stranded DNA-binding protein [Verrucomicrobiales bacterium]
MTAAENAYEILDTMLGHLGFTAQIDVEETPSGPVLQVNMEHAEALIGEHAERLEDLQYLVNRLLQAKDAGAPKVRVDVAHFREMKEDQMLDEVRAAAERVRLSGHAIKLPPMNSYHRRMVHTLFAGDPDVKSWSPEDSGRLKRITLMPRHATGGGTAP